VILISESSTLSCRQNTVIYRVLKSAIELYELSRVSLFSMPIRPLSMKRLPQLLDPYWTSEVSIPEPAWAVAVD
jgi:hypothetical protein